jgi:hypothetical protein
MELLPGEDINPALKRTARSPPARRFLVIHQVGPGRRRRPHHPPGHQTVEPLLVERDDEAPTWILDWDRQIVAEHASGGR